VVGEDARARTGRWHESTRGMRITMSISAARSPARSSRAARPRGAPSVLAGVLHVANVRGGPMVIEDLFDDDERNEEKGGVQRPLPPPLGLRVWLPRHRQYGRPPHWVEAGVELDLFLAGKIHGIAHRGLCMMLRRSGNARCGGTWLLQVVWVVPENGIERDGAT